MDRNSLREFFHKKVWQVNCDRDGQGRSYGWHDKHWNDLMEAIDQYADARSAPPQSMVPSKSSALVWAGKEAVKADPSNWDDELSWRLMNEERHRGFGRTEIEAVVDAMRNDRLTWDVTPYLKPSGEVDWVTVLKDIHHGAMSEFIRTPYGVLFMDCG
ncbi:hypothetical protein [Streptomyces sp. CB03238]|uniref:hypothetical protein n=1 Tax=Streptomyces sp. CB03238 TaxID=1907777 RepID=UPI000A0FB78E|nr:hypothetical protein [Streptomyces sp. CB03238]ORT58129.1 hypothetical protein BKD26_19695 [Streptomyces sp. CB03238]